MFHSVKDFAQLDAKLQVVAKVDRYGDKTNAIETDIKCMFVQEQNLIIGVNGKETRSQGYFIFDGNYINDIPEESYMEFRGKKYQVVGLNSYFNRAIRSAWVVYV